MKLEDINNYFGDMDLELMDQVLKGSFEGRNRILEIGCGQGRNLIYFLRQNHDVYGIDSDESSVQICRYLSSQLDRTSTDRFIQTNADNLPFIDNYFDGIISSRVFHFAKNKTDFQQMWGEQYRVLKPGGILYFTMDSVMGFEEHVNTDENELTTFRDGTVRFALSKKLIEGIEIEKTFSYVEPIRTIHYADQHAQSIVILIKK